MTVIVVENGIREPNSNSGEADSVSFCANAHGKKH